MFQVPAALSKAPSLFGPEETQEVVNVAEEKPSDKKAVPAETNKSKKPAGAVSLFGGINVLGDEAKTTTVRIKTMMYPFRYLMQKNSISKLKLICVCVLQKQSKNALEDFDDLDWQKEAPPPMETKEKKATKNTFSLFDDDEEEEEPDEIPPLSTATKHTDKSTLKVGFIILYLFYAPIWGSV